MKIFRNWYLIKGKIVHYISNKNGWFLNGKSLSIKEVYEFENINFNIIYK